MATSSDASTTAIPFENTSGVNQRSVHSIKAPPFCPDRPALWFAQLEAQFFSHNVNAEIDKFSLAVAHISTQHAAEVEDLIVSPPTITPYTTFKTALTTRFSKSKEARLQQLLDGESIGDRSPSSYLRHLKSLAPTVGVDVLRAKWSSALPEQTRALLATQTQSPLEQQALLADKIHDIYHVKHVNAVQQPTQTLLEQQVAELSQQVASLTQAFNNTSRNRSASRDRNRKVSRSPNRPFFDKTTGYCFYHHRFGQHAHKCLPKCKFPGNLKENH